jgi:hypothetical protein
MRLRPRHSLPVREYDSSVIPVKEKKLSMEDVERFVTYNQRMPFK